METDVLLEKLKESIKSDLRALEDRCNEAQNKIEILEKEHNATKELANQLQKENLSLKENVARLQKELSYKDEKLKRKTEELRVKDKWWSQYRLMSERRFKAMKDHGTFPTSILDNFVNKDIDDQMDDVPENCSSLEENEHSKKHRNLSTLKYKKKVRYNRISNLTEKKPEKSLREPVEVCLFSDTNEKSLAAGDGNLFSDPNESTKLYQDFDEQKNIVKMSASVEPHVAVIGKVLSPDLTDRQYSRCLGAKMSVHDEVSVCSKVPTTDTKNAHCSTQGYGAKVCVSNGVSAHHLIIVPDTEDVNCSPKQQDADVSVSNRVSAHPDILVPDTEDVYSEEADIGLQCSIGAPSAASTPLAAGNSPLFGYGDDDDDNEISVVSLGHSTAKSPCDDTVNLLTAVKTQLSNLPKSDSQFPVDLSYTQPQSPTIPSHTRALQQDVNVTADCSVSLLPQGMRNEEKGCKNNFKSREDYCKDDDDTVFMSNRTDKQQTRLKRDKGIETHMKKVSQQITLDAKLSKGSESESEKDASAGKRKRKGSDGNDFMWTSKSKQEQRSQTIFKAPEAPPPKTPEVIFLEEFPPRVTGRKSCSTPLSGDSGNMDQSVDLFGNMDDQRSPDVNDAKQKEALPESREKENVSTTHPPTGKPSYKYAEVVRKRDERGKLNGYECRDCQQYYQSLNLPEDELKKRLKHCSRHRARFSPPPSTPPGFWDLSFPDTQEYIDKGYLKTESQAPAPKRLRRARRNKIAK